MRLALITICLLTLGCQRVSDAAQRMPPSGAYIHVKDKVLAQLMHWGIPAPVPCPDVQTDDQCVKFTKPHHMRGFWRNNFEGSQFCTQTARCAPARTSDFTWLELDLPAGWEDTPPGGLYAIDFIGRHSEYRGMYGHLGMSDEEVIVDRLISIKIVDPPPPGQMTKEHVEAYLKECSGVRICMPNSEIPRSR